MQGRLTSQAARLGRTAAIRWNAAPSAASTSRSFVSSSFTAAQAAPPPTSPEAATPSASTSPNSKPSAPPPATFSKSARPPSDSTSESTKLSTIVDQIEGLTLLEASELVTLLKSRLNITEIAMPASNAPAAPIAASSTPAAPAEEEKPKEKTIFTVKLMGLKDASAKAKVIKEVKALNSQMNLVEAKKFVESAPQVLKEGLPKEEAEKLQKAVEAAGGQVELE